MKSLPKWLNSVIAVVAAASAVYATLHPGVPLPGWITTFTTLIAMFTHSVPGTGGQPTQ